MPLIRYTVFMHSKIIQVRLRGAKRSETDIANDPGTEGAVVLARVSGHIIMNVQQYNRDLLPTLHEAQCVGINGEFQLWRGYQRPGGGTDAESPAYLQEWRVQVLRPA